MLVAVVGPVGAGKSTLLSALVGELVPTDPDAIFVQGPVSYVAQKVRFKIFKYCNI